MDYFIVVNDNVLEGMKKEKVIEVKVIFKIVNMFEVGMG